MARYKDRRVCVRLTTEEFEYLQKIADGAKSSWQTKGNICEAIRRIVQWRRRELGDLPAWAQWQVEAAIKSRKEPIDKYEGQSHTRP